MSSCCSPLNSKNNSRHICPTNGKPYLQVPLSTVLQHIKKPWKMQHDKDIEQQYYFCSDPDCETVYFSEDNQVIAHSELRTVVGIKNPDDIQALCCYCFDITCEEARKDKELKNYVIDKTKNNVCACESQNPSGRCCLKDFPK